MAGCIFGSKEFNDHHFDGTFPPKHAAQHYAIAGTNAKSDIKQKRGNAQPINPLHWNEFWWKYNTSCNPFIGVKELMDRIMRTKYYKDQGCEDALKRRELAAEGAQHKAEKKKLNQEQAKQQQWSKPAMPSLQRVSVQAIKLASPANKGVVKIECYAAELLAPQQDASEQHGSRSVTPHGIRISLQELPATPPAAAEAADAAPAQRSVSAAGKNQSSNKDPCLAESDVAEQQAGVAAR
jgi:hypothetical protein